MLTSLFSGRGIGTIAVAASLNLIKYLPVSLYGMMVSISAIWVMAATGAT